MSHTGRPEFRLNCLSVQPGKFLQDKILHDIWRRGIFSLCADEAADCSNQEQLAVAGDTGCRPRYTRLANQLAQKAQHFLAPYCGMSFLAISALFLLYIHFGKSLWFTWIPCNEASACRVSIIKQQTTTTLDVREEFMNFLLCESWYHWKSTCRHAAQLA